MNDPYENPEFRAWARRVKEELVPKIEGSTVFASIVCEPANVDPKFAVELGCAVMLNKPIIALIRPGLPIPEKLAAVVDRFVELNPEHPETASEAIREAVAELTG